MGSSLQHAGSLVEACGLLSCGMRTLSCGMHVGSSSLIRDRTPAPCTGSAESYPLDHQGSPCVMFWIAHISDIIWYLSFSWSVFFHTLGKPPSTTAFIYCEHVKWDSMKCEQHLSSAIYMWYIQQASRRLSVINLFFGELTGFGEREIKDPLPVIILSQHQLMIKTV